MNPQPLTCLIIEDEPIAQETLIDYINTLPYLSLQGVASNAFEGMTLLEKFQPNLIFLDINLPRLSGLDWLRSLERPSINVIVTTANPNCALDAYDLNVVDYLLKPFRLDRFMKAVNRCRERIIAPAVTYPPTPSERQAEPLAIYVKEGKELVRIVYDDILCVEGMDDYVRIHTKKEVIVTSKRMHHVEESLPTPPFFRLNRSFIIHQDCVDRVLGNEVTLCNGKRITVTNKYQPAFRTMLEDIQKNM